MVGMSTGNWRLTQQTRTDQSPLYQNIKVNSLVQWMPPRIRRSNLQPSPGSSFGDEIFQAVNAAHRFIACVNVRIQKNRKT